jgi:UDP-3-O-[3-hydroxymyristoyl] glucosamine N-acyltransferase
LDSIGLRELAERIGGRLEGGGNPLIRGVAGIREAQTGEITFLAHARYLNYLEDTRASALICKPDLKSTLPTIRMDDPHLGFLRAIELFCEPKQDYFAEGVDSSAQVHPSARLGEGVRVGPGAIIGENCEIGEHSIVGPGAVVMPKVKIGERCLLYPNVVVREECQIGDRVILHAGAIIGSDGFGFAKQAGAYHKVPQIGRVIIEDDVEIGANSCVDRATVGRTVIGTGTKIDNLVQIAHNVTIGQHTVISAQTGISGSTNVGDDVMMAGQVGVVGHISIGNDARIGAQSGISKDIPAGEQWFGYPARNSREARRLLVHYNRLERYAEEISDLRRRIQELEKSKSAASTTNS